MWNCGWKPALPVCRFSPRSAVYVCIERSSRLKPGLSIAAAQGRRDALIESLKSNIRRSIRHRPNGRCA